MTRFPIQPPIEPMLAKAVASIPSDPGLCFAPKWDGFRGLDFDERFEGARMIVDGSVTVATVGESCGHRAKCEVRRLAGVEFVPGERGRHAGVRTRAHGIGGGDRSILGILVVIEEDAVTFFLPPSRPSR